MASDMSKQDIVWVAVAIPVLSFMAVAATKRTLQLAGKIWGWFTKTIAGQTADAIREVMQPSMEALHGDVMESIESMRALNSREHVETQIRLRDVETRLFAVETRLSAVETAVASTPAAVAVAAVIDGKEQEDAMADGAS